MTFSDQNLKQESGRGHGLEPEDEKRHLLVVDDDDRIRDLLQEYLVQSGFRVSVAKDAVIARRLIESLDFDLLILDVMMPGEDGFSLARWVREKQETPILILTAKDCSDDRITGLSLGADDYLAKPFAPRELFLRISAILRRSRVAIQQQGFVRFGDYRFDQKTSELFCREMFIKLTSTESKILQRLAKTPQQPVERFKLAEDMGETTDRAVDVQITRLRRKIEQDPQNPRYLQTIRGIGYRLLANLDRTL